MSRIDAFQSWQLVFVAIVLKYGLRVVFCRLLTTGDNGELSKRIFFLLEHVIFSLFGYYVTIYLPGRQSWYHNPALCWVYPSTLPSFAFKLFYIGKIGTHIEDVFFRASEIVAQRRRAKQSIAADNSNGVSSTSVNSNTAGEQKGDLMMDLHHIVTAGLCILSYCSGYFLIGSLLMLVHDVSDIPLDLVRIFQLQHWDIPLYCVYSTYAACILPLFSAVADIEYISYVSTLVAWAYFRLYVLSAVILRSIILDPTTSFVAPCSGGWRDPQCATMFYAEMGVYVSLIGALWVLHVVWYCKMLQKGYRLLISR